MRHEREIFFGLLVRGVVRQAKIADDFVIGITDRSGFKGGDRKNLIGDAI
ncbi:MAG: hypothetical protein IPP40_11635 [bacterium]|nr:hypothetical protein [bacterium]